MPLSTTTTHTIAPTTTPLKNTEIDHPVASLLSAILIATYAGKKSRKQLRQLHRKAAWLMVKQKAKSFFSRTALSERKIILYILLAILVLVLVFYYPIVALVLAIIGLILYLTGTI